MFHDNEIHINGLRKFENAFSVFWYDTGHGIPYVQKVSS